MTLGSQQDEPPDSQQVIDPLADPACRSIIQEVDDPLTAKEVSEECDLPLSTTYRKLDRLTDASLLETQVEIHRDGRHLTQYRLAFTEIMIHLDDAQRLTVTITRPLTSDQQLAAMWTEMRREA
ncbi:MAG TPA: helix-turn-helix domain-containing protein [Halococcus sp.]|nr:helix-turn-helix domain-containing protein [Halococcus sp.]